MHPDEQFQLAADLEAEHGLGMPNPWSFRPGVADFIDVELSAPNSQYPDIILHRSVVEDRTGGQQACRIIVKDDKTGKHAVFFATVKIKGGKPVLVTEGKLGNRGGNTQTVGASFLDPVS